MQVTLIPQCPNSTHKLLPSPTTTCFDATYPYVSPSKKTETTFEVNIIHLVLARIITQAPCLTAKKAPYTLTWGSRLKFVLSNNKIPTSISSEMLAQLNMMLSFSNFAYGNVDNVLDVKLTCQIAVDIKNSLFWTNFFANKAPKLVFDICDYDLATMFNK